MRFPVKLSTGVQQIQPPLCRHEIILRNTVETFAVVLTWIKAKNFI